MQIGNVVRIVKRIALMLLFVLALSGVDIAHAHSRTVILFDRSRSFEPHFEMARQRAWAYVTRVANSSPEDEVYIVGVDNHTALITYIRGVRSRNEAKKEFDRAFQNPSSGRGTDWVTGFRLAAKTFALVPKPDALHLLAFGDLRVDDDRDPATGTLNQSRFERLEKFDWSSLAGARTTLYFVDDQSSDLLRGLPAFSSLGAEVYTVESQERSRRIEPPRPVRAGREKPRSGTSPLFYLAWIALLLGGVFFLLRRPARPI